MSKMETDKRKNIASTQGNDHASKEIEKEYRKKMEVLQQ